MIGTGILKGMAVTARNFVGSYFEKDRLITVQYPEERSPLPENYRNFPFLIYDTDDAEAGLRCVACKICEKACEWGAIQGPKIIKSECVRCDDCERLYLDEKKCPHWLILLRDIKKRSDFAPKPNAV